MLTSTSFAISNIFSKIYLILRFSSNFISLPPISRQVVSSTSPLLKITLFVVPPPTSKFTILVFFSSENVYAPEPFPAIILSKSGPAVATTKSPAIPLNVSKTSFAFSFLAVSPVIITAPVDTSSYLIFAFLYSFSIIFFTFFVSITVSDINGVS